MRQFLFLSLFLLAAMTGQAQYTFHTLDIKSGISDNDVRAILRDQYGFMWFGTANGLDRYDGYHSKTYLTSSFGNYGNTIADIHEDATGRLWVQIRERFFIYDRETDQLSTDIATPLASMGIHEDIRKLYADNEKNLWCIGEHTLYKYVFTENTLYHLELPWKEVTTFTCRDTLAYLVFEDGEMIQADLHREHIQKTSHTIHARDTQIYLDTQGRLWCYSRRRPGLTCHDIRTNRPLRFSSRGILRSELINAIIDDGKGNIWIGTNSEGIVIEDKGLHTFSQLHSVANQPFELPSNHISCFYKDNRNTMWVGSSKQGIAFTNLQGSLFEICHTPVHEDLCCFQEDQQGNLWIGFDGKGLLCHTPDGKQDILFSAAQGNLPSNLVIGMDAGKDGKIWFSSYGDGIFYRQEGRFVRIHYPTGDEDESPIKFAHHVLEDDHGNLWIGTCWNGLYCRDKKGVFTSFTRENSCLDASTITALSYTPGSDTLYVGTDKGLYKMDLLHKSLAPISIKAKDGQLLDESYVHCLHQDKRGLLWIGTFNGVLIYDGKATELPRLTHEFSQPRIRGIAEDNDGNLWVTTDKGIVHIVVVDDPARQNYLFRCYPYFAEDGLGDIAFNPYSIYRTRQGEILAGGNGKYIKIYPDACQYQPVSHHVTFTNLYVANRPVNVRETDPSRRIILPKNIQLLDKITLDHSDVNFAIEVSAMDYLSRHKLHFAYRTSQDEKWIRLEGNKIYFNQLAPGAYRLQVKVDEPYGEANPVSELLIRIRPPFWFSGPAYFLYAFVGLMLLALLARWGYLRHCHTLQRQKKELEISQQHEMDEAKLRFFTNISHDLRTPLSLIITPLEQLIKSGKAPGAKNELEMMQRNAFILMNEVNQLLDFRKLDQQKVQYAPSYGNLSAFVANICETFKSMAGKREITLQVTTVNPLLEMNFDRSKMQRILFNLLTNAIKFTPTGGSITVTVDEVQADGSETARIQVADTGVGIKDENKERVFERFFQEPHSNTSYMGSGIGLHIVKEYVALHQGTITVTDNQPTGSIFCILLPIDKRQPTRQPEETSMTDNGIQQENLPTATDKDYQLLIVEDNDDFRKFLASCLKDKYHVQEAANGQQALEVLEQQTVNLIISDVMMPVMDGMELCRRIKHDIRYSHIPIILLTARTAEEHVLSGLKEGADDYITKPFNLDILLLRIQRLLAWTQENHRKFQTMNVSPAEITVSTIDEELIGRAVQIMEEEMDNADFSVEDFSNRLGLSRSGLYKKLMQITGKSPLEFMRILRLKRGKTLLEQSGDSVSQIAYQVGMSPKQFSKFFKEEFGHLPSEHKKHSNGNFALT